MQPHCIYINLDRRQDRRVQIESELAKMNLTAERFPAIARSPGGLGCTHSHLAVLKLARARGYESVLVFEDDFAFSVEPEEFHSAMKSIPSSFDVILLAYNLIRGSPTNLPTLGRVFEAQAASAYIVHSRYYTTLIEQWEKGVELYEANPHQHWLYINDQYWKPLQLKGVWYYFLRPLGMQRPSWSDLGQKFMDTYR